MAAEGDPGSIIGQRVGIYTRKRIKADFRAPEELRDLETYGPAELEVAGIVRHVWTDSEDDLCALIEEEGAEAGALSMHALSWTGSAWDEDRRREVWALAPGQDAEADPASKERRAEWSAAAERIRLDEEERTAAKAREAEAQARQRHEAEEAMRAWHAEFWPRVDAAGLHRTRRRHEDARRAIAEQLAREWEAAGRRLPG